MYGHYSKDLGEFARREAARVRVVEERRQKKKSITQEKIQLYQDRKWITLKSKHQFMNIICYTRHYISVTQF